MRFWPAWGPAPASEGGTTSMWYGLFIAAVVFTGIIYIAALPGDARKPGRRRRKSSASSSDSSAAYAGSTDNSSGDSGSAFDGGSSGGGDGGGGGGGD